MARIGIYNADCTVGRKEGSKATEDLGYDAMKDCHDGRGDLCLQSGAQIAIALQSLPNVWRRYAYSEEECDFVLFPASFL